MDIDRSARRSLEDVYTCIYGGHVRLITVLSSCAYAAAVVLVRGRSPEGNNWMDRTNEEQLHVYIAWIVELMMNECSKYSSRFKIQCV